MIRVKYALQPHDLDVSSGEAGDVEEVRGLALWWARLVRPDTGMVGRVRETQCLARLVKGTKPVLGCFHFFASQSNPLNPQW